MDMVSPYAPNFALWKSSAIEIGELPAAGCGMQPDILFGVTLKGNHTYEVLSLSLIGAGVVKFGHYLCI